ncbi:MAG: IclR family transcriptional regulator [Anaerolineales bacterium]|nr:MAG: IclR family transcriptional regulator [Anaerolineales bacterium]
MKDPSDYNVRAVERAARILASFDNEHPVMGLSEIAQAVDLHKSTTHRIVTTLLQQGFLERAIDGQKYRLGVRLANLGFRVIQRMDIRREAIPVMTKLRDQWDETCDLSIFDDNNVFYIEVMHSNHALTIAAAVGQNLPAHCTASGKMFLANLNSQELSSFLKKPLRAHTENTVTSPDELQSQLQRIAEQGYSVDQEEYELGICAVSAPILDQSGTMVAALSIPSPTSRMTPPRIIEISAAVIEASQSISRCLGWTH